MNEIEDFKKRIIDYENVINILRQNENKIKELESIIIQYKRKIEELMQQLNDTNNENAKRTKRITELEVKNKDISLYEDKIAMLSQQLEFSSKKI